MNRKRKLFISLLVGDFVLLVLGYILTGSAQIVLLVLCAITLITFIILWVVLWRCPYCGAHLGRIDDCGTYCKYCGKELHK